MKAAWLATVRGEFDRMRMDDGDELDVYTAKVYGMATRYAMLRAMLDNTTMVK